MKTATAKPSNIWSRIFPALLLLAILGLLFWRSFHPDFVHFNNDGPLGQQATAQIANFPGNFFGGWSDMNDVGGSMGAWPISWSALITWILGPVGFAKFMAPLDLFILGLGAWIFFRSLELTSLAAILGALAAMLNGNFLGRACWGVASQDFALGMDFLALALIVANSNEPSRLLRWLRLALAGLCVGINVIEAADIGALCSMIIAAFVFYKTLIEDGRPRLIQVGRGISQVVMIAVFAGFIAYQAIIGLVGSSITGVAEAAKDTETTNQHWDWATQWSLPKKETLGLIIPGLFGYKMDTPNNMMPQFQDAYRGGAYWGGMGRSPDLDRFLDAGAQGTPPPGFMRFTGGESYSGTLVTLLAAWTVAQSLRRKNSPFNPAQKKLIWFWLGVLVVSLPLAWGRFAPLFYGLLYHLPYFSTIRNPDKFLIFFSWSLVILFAFSIHALGRQHMVPTAPKAGSLSNQLKNWWNQANNFDRRWTLTIAGIFGVGVMGGIIYSAEQTHLIRYLQMVGFPDEEQARQIAAFSLEQVAWWLALFATAGGLVAAVVAGYFNGPRARLGALLLGAFLLFDLGRADLPFVIHWDYKQKYEVGSLNPIVDFLRKKPYEHRVVGLPFHAPQGMELLDQLYRIEWTQHLFLYYNIQCLDVIQMSRIHEEIKAYLEALSPRGTPESIPLLARHWQLTNTRYILGPAGYLDVLNQQLDPGKNRFHIVQRFTIALKPGITEFHQRLEELTTYPKNDGEYALFEFTGALPRVKLYSNWQINTNLAAALKTISDLNFDPEKTVIISTPQKNLPATATNDNSGTVEFTSYAPRHIAFSATATAPSVLLLNDRFDPGWHVTVDRKPADLLRCNFLMRGVYLEPGTHSVEFNFSLPNKPLYITLSAIGVGILLSGLLFFLSRRQPTPADKP